MKTVQIYIQIPVNFLYENVYDKSIHLKPDGSDHPEFLIVPYSFHRDTRVRRQGRQGH